jgi:formylglycine-generating enzyme required for sulfatase activity
LPSGFTSNGGSTWARYGPRDEVAWYNKNSGGQTHTVGEKRPIGFGLYDVLGNVEEWVNDWYDYQNSPSQDPSGPASGQARVLRGGSWVIYPGDVRVLPRVGLVPGDWDYDLGFRCGGR